MKKHILNLALIILFVGAPITAYSQNDLDTKIMLEDLRKLSHDEAEGRKSGTKGAEAARQFIIKQMDTVNPKHFVKGYRHPFTFVSRGDTIKGENIISYIQGESDSAFIITAHYDHIGIIRGEVYNGADDNASGVAALLAMLEYFKNNKPRHTLIFAALDAEEMGLQGARAIFKDANIPLENIILNVNMDMISMNDKNELYVAGTHYYPKFKSILEKVQVPPLKLRFGHDSPDLGKDDWTMQSDHGVFHQNKIPFLYFGVEDHEHYHRATDEFENVNQAFYIKAAHAVLYSIIELDKNLN
ncbi:M28 family peptidase [Roseivirga echinicomitans]